MIDKMRLEILTKKQDKKTAGGKKTGLPLSC